MSLLTRPMRRGEDGREAADDGDDGQRLRHRLEQREGARDQVDARGDHRRGVDQRRDRRRALHRVGQPDVERELAALADRAREQAQARPEQHRLAEQAGVEQRARCCARPGRTARVSCSVPPTFHRMIRPIRKPTSPTRVVRNAFLAAIHGGSRCTPRLRGAIVPEADQQVAAQADQLPADEQEQQVVGQDDRQHAEGEQRQVGEEAAVARVADGRARSCTSASRSGPGS